MRWFHHHSCKKAHIVAQGYYFLLFNFIGSLMKGFQWIPHIFEGLTMRYEIILINPKRGDEDIPCFQIVLDLLFVIIAPIGFRLILDYTVVSICCNLWLKPTIGKSVSHIHIHRLDVNAHAFFPIVIIFFVKNRCSIIRPLGLLASDMDQLFR